MRRRHRGRRDPHANTSVLDALIVSHALRTGRGGGESVADLLARLRFDSVEEMASWSERVRAEGCARSAARRRAGA